MIGIIIVSYKNFQGTVDFINNQLSKITQPWKVVIIDNDSNEETGNRMARACKGVCVYSKDDIVNKDEKVFVLPIEVNLGFARGNNLGADFLIKNFCCKHLLFTNDDIILEDSTVLEKLKSCLINDCTIGAIGPRVIGIDKIDQSPHYRIITPLRQLGWKLFPYLRKKRKASTAVACTPESSFCYWVSGCFFMMRTEDFIAVEGFDPSTFLYAEEAILAERLKRIGKREYLCATTHIIHYGGCSTKSIQSKKLKKILKESNSIYYSKYLHCNPIIVWLYKKLC